MGKGILIISTTETFTVRGLEMKLKSIGLEPVFSVPRIKEMEPLTGAADLIILYTDDMLQASSELLVYIKDHCAEHEKQIVVIGSTNEYESVKKHIPERLILKFYERPLDMERFLSEMGKHFSKDAGLERKKKILIVDDDVSYMTMIMDWLKDRYSISLANSGMQALTWLAKNRPDLILLDYEMPVTSGPQVLEMIRSDAAMADIPVMFLTGKSDKESIMKVLALKPVGYQLKTIDRNQLRENIANYFALQKGKM